MRTVANIIDNFKPGETYNIAGSQQHTIEELSSLVLKVTGANPDLVQWRDPEMMTTRHKLVDASKAIRDLGHEDTHDLEQGLRLTADWMRTQYTNSPRGHRRGQSWWAEGARLTHRPFCCCPGISALEPSRWLNPFIAIGLTNTRAND